MGSQSDSGSHSQGGRSQEEKGDATSMIETQEAPLLFSDSEDEAGQMDSVAPFWGLLHPISQNLMKCDRMLIVSELRMPEHVIGRSEECDYCITTAHVPNEKLLLAISKRHFRIFQETTLLGSDIYIEDLSSNGTYLNGEKIGKGQKRVLTNNDVIALASPCYKAFVFMTSLGMDDDTAFPKEITQKYTVSRVLGRGACGEVRLGFSKDGSCGRVAIKIIEKKKFTSKGTHQVDQLELVHNEVAVLRALSHPCIIQILDVIDTERRVYIILELVEGGELFDRVKDSGKLPESLAKLLFYQMVIAIKHLHDNGITHRDLKPENVLLASTESETLIKVTDFGLSKFIGETSMMKTFCGTPHYLAPEILRSQGKETYTNKVDCWSLGVILYICLGGYPPFSDEYKDMSLGNQILLGRLRFHPKHWVGISENAKDLIRKLLTVDSQARFSLDDTLDHPWFQDEEMKRKADNLMVGSRSMQSMKADVEKLLAFKKRPRTSSITIECEEHSMVSPSKKVHLDESTLGCTAEMNGAVR
ncbi:unnamed protein product [Darwinula stevensoni]|uniref:Uncharacterized protein n=1 Tax=Darwinula stevensoni TaxID=69355 RepID=A0A7R8XE05_9CRUS|nr:unnamed protein product [Darwinula stevensoni]CAG0889192.1 unnamed protein product [Darwinula stevensoni]